ncbi:MAG: hypothetical protein HKN91_13205, partial [Acidimicrobiia bacterium]|nr:hypothetical protein [Acidimicrobiia bacterium]
MNVESSLPAIRSYLEALDGIGPVRASSLRELGIDDWLDVSAVEAQLSLFPSALASDALLLNRALEEQDPFVLSARLPQKLRYLLIDAMPDKTLFLDIETTGLSQVYHSVTLVGWSAGGRYSYELVGRDRTPSEAFLAAVRERPVVASFNGILFDIPFLDTLLDLPAIVNVDLRYLANRLGYSGSQKQVELNLGVKRSGGVNEVRGADAPALWFRATRGDFRALHDLIVYNFYDIRGLARIFKKLLPIALRTDQLTRSLRDGGLNARRVEVPMKPKIVQRTLIADHQADLVPQSIPLFTFQNSRIDRRRVVVGVDLTGSDQRPSGLAVLSGTSTKLATIGPLDEIERFVIEANPDLVSIDAPLCLPVGRTAVTDDDPARVTHGIMRESERLLKRRGVNVYPCLLPSMQQLTRRGIELATRLRNCGIATIESYPGAAQDMLAMPRKGVGIPFLLQSLRETGLDLPNRPINHDELDAVTSAIVGVFFLSDMYEELAGPGEDPLIVPARQRRSDAPRAVVFSGRIGAGKTTAGRMIESLGATYGRYSMVVASEAQSRGLAPNRQ